MRARRLIDRASFGPDQLKIIGQAFDATWAQISPSVSSESVEVARLKLANCILGLAKNGILNAEQLTSDALAAMHEPPTELR